MNRFFVSAIVAAAVLAPVRSYAVSLWQGEVAVTSSMFTDRKARQVNDIITVVISEQSTATRNAVTSTGRETTVDGKVENWFTVDNLRSALSGILGSANVKTRKADTANLPVWKFSSKNDYKGSGNTLRNDRFEAKITCIVREILPNSNMVIQGQQNVTVNAEDQTIVLTGIVRPEDVTANNIVYSYNVADAKIYYTGKGPLGDKQRRGIFEFLGDCLWPF
jgi:flagellar L-ring protein precursor FlgH